MIGVLRDLWNDAKISLRGQRVTCTWCRGPMPEERRRTRWCSDECKSLDEGESQVW